MRYCQSCCVLCLRRCRYAVKRVADECVSCSVVWWMKVDAVREGD